MELSNLLSFGAFVIAVISGVIALSKKRSEIAVNEATEAEKISAAWERLNKPNQERIDALEAELRNTKAELKSAKEELVKAFSRIKELEIENSTLRRGGRTGRGLAMT